jgi:hypothetical protein
VPIQEAEHAREWAGVCLCRRPSTQAWESERVPMQEAVYTSEGASERAATQTQKAEHTSEEASERPCRRLSTQARERARGHAGGRAHKKQGSERMAVQGAKHTSGGASVWSCSRPCTQVRERACAYPGGRARERVSERVPMQETAQRPCM